MDHKPPPGLVPISDTDKPDGTKVTKVPEDSKQVVYVPDSPVTPNGKNTRGETHISVDESPIRPEGNPPIIYSINSSVDGEIAIEDDETLEMQIQLGDVQERNLKRKIEHKRRKANASSSHDASFDLSRELSMEIDRDHAAKYREVLAKCKNLENELALVKSRAQLEIQLQVEQISAETKVAAQKHAYDVTARIDAQYKLLAEQREQSMKQTVDDRVRQEAEFIRQDYDLLSVGNNIRHERNMEELVAENRKEILNVEARFAETHDAMDYHVRHEQMCAERLNAARHNAEFTTLRAELEEKESEMFNKEAYGFNDCSRIERTWTLGTAIPLRNLPSLRAPMVARTLKP